MRRFLARLSAIGLPPESARFRGLLLAGLLTLMSLMSAPPLSAGQSAHKSGAREQKAATPVKAKGSNPKRAKVRATAQTKSTKKRLSKSRTSASKSARKSIRKSTRKSARKSARHSVRKSVRKTPRKTRRAYRPARPTMARVFGLHQSKDPAKLRSSVALLMDAQSGRVLLEKNGAQVLPIASITKLMTVMVVLDAEQSMREMLRITKADIDRVRGSRSRLRVGTRLSRREMITLALMASENRAANALGRYYPGGLAAFVSAMNAKAKLLGLMDTRFAEPTGLSGANMSNARDLARLLVAASEYPMIAKASTRRSLSVDTGYRVQRFGSTNRLVVDKSWDILVQKTGYISEAGRCLVLLAQIDGRSVAMVFLASQGKYTRIADARRARRWITQSGELTTIAMAEDVQVDPLAELVTQ